MKFRKILVATVLYLPDVLLLCYLALVYLEGEGISSQNVTFFLAILAYVVIKIIVHAVRFKYFYRRRINTIRTIISNFRKGRFISNEDPLPVNDEISDIYNQLFVLGKYLDSLFSSQNEEINKFRELYNNIVFSVSAYFVVLNEKDEVLFANESFCKNFQYSVNEITGQKITDLFFFSGGRIGEALEEVKKTGEAVILRQSRLLSKNRIAVIADMKFGRVTVQGENQVIIVMDDVTSRCRKDYQISLISQISESIQRDDEIDRVLYSILTAVTSGAGLGFNRAMLFLYDEHRNALVGKMAVGPDSFEEALQIWGTLQGENAAMLTRIDEYRQKDRDLRGRALYDQVVSTWFPIGEESLFVQVLKSQKNYHVHDAWHDSSVDEKTREFMGVPEFVVVPLIAGSRAIGVIIVDNKYNHSPIWHDSVELLSIFAVQAALSIESCSSLTMVREQMDKIQSKQDAIVESEKLAAVGRIAAHIAHEIRNPLVTVGGYARRIIQQSKNPSAKPEDTAKAATVILQEAERLEKILSNVMDFTRPSPYIREFNNMNDVVNDTISLLKNVIQERKLDCRLNLKEDLPLVKSDFNQLKQVMLNLIQNAMDATPAGGAVMIETLKEGDHVVILVRDTGSGIAENDLSSLFEPFFTTKITGVGLGLAIVKKIINDHNGEITVRNRPEGGAEFRIDLPVPA